MDMQLSGTYHVHMGNVYYLHADSEFEPRPQVPTVLRRRPKSIARLYHSVRRYMKRFERYGTRVIMNYPKQRYAPTVSYGYDVEVMQYMAKQHRRSTYVLHTPRLNKRTKKHV